MIALLEEAIGTYQKNAFSGSRHGRKLFREAESWLMTEEEHAGLRFDDVCGLLDIDPDWVRRALRGWRAGTRSRSQPAGPDCPPGATST